MRTGMLIGQAGVIASGCLIAAGGTNARDQSGVTRFGVNTSLKPVSDKSKRVETSLKSFTFLTPDLL